MAEYKSLRSSNESVCIKGDRRVPVLDGDKIVDYDWLDGIYANFKDYKFVTEDANIIKWLDEPKNGYGVGWIKIEEPKSAPVEKKK
jgi:hypothetical protein